MKPVLPLTRAELTGCRETSTHEDVLKFCQVLSRSTDQVRIEYIGRSGRGQAIPAIIISPSKAFTPEKADQMGLLKILVIANIHAGEVEGKEACLMLARDLTVGSKKTPAWLKKCVLVIVPNYNPDGNDLISTKNRVLELDKLDGQVGPTGGVGTRYTGEGINLNRDYTKQEAIESVHLSKYFGRWWPHLAVDCHTTNGSIHGYHLTWDTSHTLESGPHGPILYSRDTMLPEIGRRLLKRRGWRTFFYGNYVDNNDPTKGWVTYSPMPRYGSHYRGLTGRMDILLEAYSYIPFEERVPVMYDTLLEIFFYATENSKKIIEIVNRAEKETIARGTHPSPFDHVGINYGVAQPGPGQAVTMTYPAHPFPGKVPIVGWDFETLKKRRIHGGKLKTYQGPFFGRFAPSRLVRRPFAYVVPKSAVERLRNHNVVVEKLLKPVEADVERYLILAMKETESPDVGTHKLTEQVLWTRGETVRRTIPTGSYIVRTAQPLASVAIYLLEPESDDGFARWSLLREKYKVGGEFPLLRINAPLEFKAKRIE